MNPNTGAIAHFETELDAKLAGHTVKLSKKDANALMSCKSLSGKNRKHRRSALAVMRREKRRATKGHAARPKAMLP